VLWQSSARSRRRRARGRSGPCEHCALTKLTTFAVLLRDRDGEDYAIEATYCGLTRPSVDGGPYLAQEAGVVFFVDRIEGERIFGQRVSTGRGSLMDRP
jgi:hypothetical protein